MKAGDEGSGGNSDFYFFRSLLESASYSSLFFCSHLQTKPKLRLRVYFYSEMKIRGFKVGLEEIIWPRYNPLSTATGVSGDIDRNYECKWCLGCFTTLLDSSKFSLKCPDERPWVASSQTKQTKPFKNSCNPFQISLLLLH